ncbi:MAG TPA: DUF4159 domain-containing protein [Tepidisphaeraceae bacterium]|jgi:hypothetical protein|nr:DUF4159 domain-containing protein [Tepidisphaeraceae bacterium]
MSLKIASCLLAGSLSLLAMGKPASAATPKEVEEAIKKAKAFLISKQNAAGNWEAVQQQDPKGGNADVNGKQWGGVTSIVTYALLAAGTSPQAPELAKPVAFLKAAKIDGIYATGLRCQVWYLLDDDKLRPYLNRDALTLLNAIHTNGAPDSIGFYPYFYDKPPIDGWFDRSVSQYGVLGVWALQEAGYEIPTRYWVLVDNAWRKAQHADGGWNYNTGAAPASTASMTAAGVATLFITQDNLLGNLAECRGNIVNLNIDAGMGWMDKHIKEALGSGNYYGMYGIERIGVASGRKYFETVDWYQEGADFIVKHQAPDGSWGGLPDTCFSLLFLVRGRAPIVMNKVDYSTLERNGKVVEGPWNERPRDCANFAHWMGRNVEEHNLNWQIVNLKVSPEELHDSQILYISGDKEFTLSQGEIAKLRTFVEEGGLILGNADCGRRPFAKSFEDLGAKMFPKYEFRDLPAGHIIYTEQFNGAKWHPKPKIMGKSNGVRELMLLIPEADVSRAWHGRNDKTKADLFQLGANIFLYSVDKKNLQYKGETYLVSANPAVQTTRSINMGRLILGENPDPEPGGWPRMAAVLHNEQKVALNVKDVKCDAASLKGIKVLHFTGTTTFTLNDTQRAALKDFVNGGGTLIIDAAGGSATFAGSVESELETLFNQQGSQLPFSSPVYTLPGEVIDSVAYRNFARKTLVGGNKSPRIKAISIKGRLAVFYSREDLSAGIVGESMDGILGYEPASATALMRNLIMFGAFGFPAPPATQPATKPATNPAKLPSPAAAPTTKPATLPAAPPVANPAPVPAPAPAKTPPAAAPTPTPAPTPPAVAPKPAAK